MVRARLVGDEPSFEPGQGAAILLTHDCQLDKPEAGTTAAKVKRLQFSPITRLADSGISNGIKGQLRAAWLSPPEAVYLPDSDEMEEAVALLSEAFTIPAGYFALEIVDFSDHDGSDPANPHHAVARSHDERVTTMRPAERQLLECKMAAYWAGRRLEDAPSQ